MKTMITFLLVFLICNYLYPQTADSSSGINSNLFALCPHSSEITVNAFESETAAGASGCFIDPTAPSLSVTILYASSQESKFCALSHTSRSFNTKLRRRLADCITRKNYLHTEHGPNHRKGRPLISAHTSGRKVS